MPYWEHRKQYCGSRKWLFCKYLRQNAMQSARLWLLKVAVSQIPTPKCLVMRGRTGLHMAKCGKEARAGTVGAGDGASRVPASTVGAGPWRLIKVEVATDRCDAMEPRGSDRARRVPRVLYSAHRQNGTEGKRPSATCSARPLFPLPRLFSVSGTCILN